MDNRKISLCITTYNRPILTMKAFEKVLNDERINNILIYDDGSDDENYDQLSEAIGKLNNKKVKLYSREQNEGMSLAKKQAIALAENDSCIILDSDNEIDTDYLDALYEIEEWSADTIYCPSYAKPHFDYTMYEDHYIDSEDISVYLQDSKFKRLINTCNYFLNKNEYLKVYQYNKEVKGTDTMWFAYNWLKEGNGFYVVPGLYYQHKVWQGSGWQLDLQENRKKAKEIEMLIREL